MVTLTYSLYIDDENGKLVEQATEARPLKFLYGAGMMLPKFETGLAGLREGEAFTIKLDVKDAYGDVDENAVVELPIRFFMVDGKVDYELVREGNIVPMIDSEGRHLNGMVLEVGDEFVRMDFNHPLAGEDLYFAGNVLSVSEASEEELNRYLSGGGCGCSHSCSPEADCNCNSCGSESGCGC